jgi:HAD superfamily hydrolase (TIGR01662 family)
MQGMQTDFANARWIFFDVGYTLLDETAAWQQRFEMMSKLLATRGMDVPVARMWKLFDDVCREFEPLQWLGLCKRLHINAAEATELGKGYQHALETPHAGAVHLLAKLSAKYKIGIIANQSLGTAQRLEKHDMRHYIELVIGSAEAGVRKPDVKIFQMAMQQAGCTAEEAVMVGDRIDNDVAPAKSLGWKTIHVRQGCSRLQMPRSEAERATATVDAVADVAGLLALG